MAIPGITNRVRYQRLGKIRLGEKVQGKRGEYPKATDHFVFDEAALPVREIYGDNCVVIAPVMLPGNPKQSRNGWDFETFWKTSRSAYGKASGLFCRSTDGEIATRVNKGVGEDQKPIDRQGWAALQVYEKTEGHKVDVGELFDMPCPGEECPLFENKTCKNLGSLDVMLPRVAGFGVWTIQTSSFNSIRNIESTLQQLADVLGGQLTGIPLMLRLVAQQAQVEGKAKTIFVIELICPANLQQLVGLRRKALESGGSILASIEGEIPPDDLYANAGANLDKELKVTPAGATTGPEDPALFHVERARMVGAALGMSKAQVEIAVRKAGDHIASMVDTWERQLEEKGGAVEEKPIPDGIVTGGRIADGAVAGDGNPVFDQWAQEARNQSTDPTRGPAPAVEPASVPTGIGKHPLVKEAEQRKRDQEKEDKKKERDEADKQGRLVPPTDTTYAL